MPIETAVPLTERHLRPGDVPNLTLPQTGFVREARLLFFVPFSHSTLWRRVRAGTFPAPIKLSIGVTAWRAEEIQTWIRAQGTPADLGLEAAARGSRLKPAS